MMTQGQIAETARLFSLTDAREIKHKMTLKTTPLTDAEWVELLAAERILAKAGELQYAFYNED